MACSIKHILDAYLVYNWVSGAIGHNCYGRLLPRSTHIGIHEWCTLGSSRPSVVSTGLCWLEIAGALAGEGSCGRACNPRGTDAAHACPHKCCGTVPKDDEVHKDASACGVKVAVASRPHRAGTHPANISHAFGGLCAQRMMHAEVCLGKIITDNISISCQHCLLHRGRHTKLL